MASPAAEHRGTDPSLMDQHGLTRADMAPILGTPSRVSEVLRGKKGLSMAMVQRLRARFRVPADCCCRRQSMRRPVAALNKRRPDWPWRSAAAQDRPLADSARLGPETYRRLGQKS